MTRPLFLLFLICLRFSFNCSAQKTDSLIDKFNQTDFKISFDKRDIPKSFLKYYYCMQLKYRTRKQAQKFSIANPNEAFNPFDFGGNGLPNRRLILGSKGIFDDLYFIYFEKGGAVQGQKYLFVISYDHNKIKRFQALSINDDAMTYDSLKMAVINKRYFAMK